MLVCSLDSHIKLVFQVETDNESISVHGMRRGRIRVLPLFPKRNYPLTTPSVRREIGDPVDSNILLQSWELLQSGNHDLGNNDLGNNDEKKPSTSGYYSL
jgi:hypothetical protein